MKRFVNCALALIVCLTASALADWDVQGLTDEELLDYRRAITAELASRRRAEIEAAEGATIAELFPDEWIAGHVRDALGKFSTGDVVTQDELDTIKRLTINGQTTDHIQVATLEGIQYLRALEELTVVKQDAVTEIPEWIGTLTQLKSLTFRLCPVKEVPDCVCDLVGLTELSFNGSDIAALPEDIGCLENLKRLDISRTKITSLPESVYALQLEKFLREGLSIEE